jgi:hypothetical protein
MRVQVQALFADCGEINAITIPVDKFTGRAKGFAYLEFAAKVLESCRATGLLCVARSVCQSRVLGATRGTCRRILTASSVLPQESVLTAMEKNNALLRDRPIKVVNKRTNLPSWQVRDGCLSAPCARV